jgi:hypothetical protein
MVFCVEYVPMLTFLLSIYLSHKNCEKRTLQMIENNSKEGLDCSNEYTLMGGANMAMMK